MLIGNGASVQEAIDSQIIVSGLAKLTTVARPSYFSSNLEDITMNRRSALLKVTLLLSIAAPVGTVFGQEKTKTVSPDHHYLHKVERPHAAEWSYKGATGPEHWGDLTPEYALAKTGKHQSPIDISETVSKRLPALDFEYKPTKINLIYNGHSVQENEDPGGFAVAGGKRYALQQFHFHSPSEHTVDGKHFPMEMHLVHQAEDGTLAVAAVLIEEGEHNKAFDPIWAMLPDANQPSRDSELLIETTPLLPTEHSYYTYDGSLTTPPCSEHVTWAVLTTPVSLSKKQIMRFRAVINGNNRPVQPYNGRVVSRSQSQ